MDKIIGSNSSAIKKFSTQQYYRFWNDENKNTQALIMLLTMCVYVIFLLNLTYGYLFGIMLYMEIDMVGPKKIYYSRIGWALIYSMKQKLCIFNLSTSVCVFLRYWKFLRWAHFDLTLIEMTCGAAESLFIHFTWRHVNYDDYLKLVKHIHQFSVRNSVNRANCMKWNCRTVKLVRSWN